MKFKINVGIEDIDLPQYIKEDIESKAEYIADEYCKKHGKLRGEIYESINIDVILTIHDIDVILTIHDKE